jgi:hypothetical protein
MKLLFLGTRGEIEARTRRPRMHSSLLVSYRSTSVMIPIADSIGWENSSDCVRERLCSPTPIWTTPAA